MLDLNQHISNIHCSIIKHIEINFIKPYEIILYRDAKKGRGLREAVIRKRKWGETRKGKKEREMGERNIEKSL